MPTCGTPFFTIATLFFIGIVVGVLVILCLRLRGISFKRKHGFKDSEMIKFGKMNPGRNVALHNDRKETDDGSSASNDIKRN